MNDAEHDNGMDRACPNNETKCPNRHPLLPSHVNEESIKKKENKLNLYEYKFKENQEE